MLRRADEAAQKTLHEIHNLQRCALGIRLGQDLGDDQPPRQAGSLENAPSLVVATFRLNRQGMILSIGVHQFAAFCPAR